eukprot:364861-Chlamydomonas_euryale.AAC.13
MNPQQSACCEAGQRTPSVCAPRVRRHHRRHHRRRRPAAGRQMARSCSRVATCHRSACAPCSTSIRHPSTPLRSACTLGAGSAGATLVARG